MAKSADAIFVLALGMDGVASSHSVALRKIKAVSSEVDYEFFRSHRHRPGEELVYAGAYQKIKTDVLFAALPEILRKTFRCIC